MSREGVPSEAFIQLFHSSLVYRCEWHTLYPHAWIAESDDLTPKDRISGLLGACLLLCIYPLQARKNLGAKCTQDVVLGSGSLTASGKAP